MATSFQVKCINKNPREDRYNAITHIGGHGTTPWKLTLQDAINRIESGAEGFHTFVNSHRREIVVASRGGRKYLRTEADHDTPDNLLSLPECP